MTSSILQSISINPTHNNNKTIQNLPKPCEGVKQGLKEGDKMLTITNKRLRTTMIAITVLEWKFKTKKNKRLMRMSRIRKWNKTKITSENMKKQ